MVSVPRLTIQVQNPPSETQEDLHPRPRAPPELVFPEGLLGDGVGCDVGDMDCVKPPLGEEVDFSLGSVPNQDGELDQVVATPTNIAPEPMVCGRGNHTYVLFEFFEYA